MSTKELLAKIAAYSMAVCELNSVFGTLKSIGDRNADAIANKVNELMDECRLAEIALQGIYDDRD